MGRIQGGSGLVQQQDGSLLGQGPGNHHHLRLAPGNLRQQPGRQVQDAGLLHGLQGQIQILPGIVAPPL